MTTAPVNGLRKGRAGRIPPTHWLAVFFVIALGLFPLTLALLRLWAVTGIGPVEALFTVHQQPGAMDALRFSALEAFASTLLTVCLGLPIAWGFGRYRWRNLRTKRATGGVGEAEFSCVRVSCRRFSSDPQLFDGVAAL